MCPQGCVSSVLSSINPRGFQEQPTAPATHLGCCTRLSGLFCPSSCHQCSQNTTAVLRSQGWRGPGQSLSLPPRSPCGGILAAASTLLPQPVQLEGLSACSPPPLAFCSTLTSCLCRHIRVHSCRIAQLGGTSRLRFFQAHSACVSQGRESRRSSQRSSEKTETAGLPFY